MKILSLITFTIILSIQINADDFSLIKPVSIEKAPVKTISSTKVESKKIVPKVQKKEPAKNLTKTKTLNINFQSKKSTIPDEDIKKIEEFRDYLNENKGYQVVIYSHTDSSGEEADNLSLSQQRAKNIKKALVSEGISSTRLTAIGKGEAEHKNNSIEVLIIK